MGYDFTLPVSWVPAETPWISKNWQASSEGAFTRQRNSTRAVYSVANMVNHVITRQPRMVFNQLYQQAQADSTGVAPLFRWKYLDSVTNARNQKWRFMFLPRTSGSGDCYAAREGTSDKTDLYNYSATTARFPQDLFMRDFVFARGAAPGSEQTRGISTFNGATLLDCVVQDMPVDSPVDSGTYSIVTPSVQRGQPILTGILEDIRAKFHDARKNNLTVCVCWHAIGNTTKPSAAPGNQFGLRIDSTTYVNVLDQTVTARTATSPGSTTLVQYAGRGPEGKDQGKRVKVLCRVYCNSDGANDGTIKLEGPSHITNNYTEITATAGATGWVGGSNHYLYLNSQVEDDDATTARNKIDIFAKAGASSPLYIWGIYCYAAWE